MKNNGFRVNWFLVVTLFTLVLGGCIGGAASQPASGQASGTVAPSVTLPLIAPSIESGKNDFQQYCASCHSQSNLIKAGAIPNVNLISTDWLKGTSPGQMFTALTAGKPNRGMPAFDSLSVSDRWDLVAYLLSLVSSQNDQAGGRLIYQNMCQSCHGGDGSGSGVQSAAQGLATVDWQNDPLFAEYSNQDLYDIIHSGNEHGMDQFAVMLSDRQLWSMVAISRALSISAPIASVSLPQTTSGQLATSQNQGFFTIKGKVTNGSGGDLHDLNTVNLDISADGQTLYQMVSTVLADNTFQFVLVPYNPDWSYTAEIDHQDIVYRSPRISGQSVLASEIVPLMIRVYDSTSDTTSLRGERLHVLLNFQKNDMIHVTESFLVSNPSSFTISPKDLQSPLMQFVLNKKAQSVSFDDFSEAQSLSLVNGNLADWQPILPGSVHQVMFEYDLPFENEQNIEFNTPVQVISAMVMVENQGSLITCSGMQTFDQQMAASESVLVFTGGNLNAGGKLSLRCFNKQEIFPIMIGISALVFALLVVLWIAIVSKKKVGNAPKLGGKGTKKTTLLDAIITLDDQFKAGEISAEVYRAKREELIKKLEGE
jgi:mono/diheme cytochrome c family protein